MAACVGGVALTCTIGLLGLNSPIVDRPVYFVSLRILTPLGLLAIAWVAFARRSSERLAELLAAEATVMAISGLTAASAPVPFAIGRVAVSAALLIAIYASLGYPRGRIDDHVSRIIIGTAAVGSAVLLAANLLLSSVPPVAGPFVRCVGSECPENPLNLVDIGSRGSRALSTALGLWTASMLLAAAILLVRRVRRATRLQRRSLTPVVAWAVVAAVGFGWFMSLRAIDERSSLLTPSAMIIAAIVGVQPFAFALGMARGRVFAVLGLEHTVAGLAEGPSPEGLQRAMARAFRDPALRLLFWLPAATTYVDIGGRRFELAAAEHAREVTQFRRDGDPIAAVVHDPALGDDPEVLEATGTAMLIALENARLQADLRASIAELEASRSRIASAADEERRRIEHDLHDGAQQRLIALQIRLTQLEQRAQADPGSLSQGLQDARKHVDAALDQIRNLAHGIYPPVLSDLGIRSALKSIARELPLRVALDVDCARRFAPEIEAAVYFCCLEALQNIAKHCRPDATVRLTLSDNPNGLEFEIADDGQGFDPGAITNSRGISGMRDRLETIGGELTVSSSPGAGTSVSGRVPPVALEAQAAARRKS